MLWKDRNSIYFNSYVNVIKFRNLMQIMQIYKDDRKRYLWSRLKHTNHYLSTVFVNIINTT